MVYQIIYSSALRIDVTPEEMFDIARKAQSANSLIGITGMMVCHQGSILQVLEGKQSDVEKLYAKIAEDPRHTQILLLIARDAEKREFSDWAMGFKHLPDNDADPKATPLLAKTYKEILPENASDVLQAISKSFARVNGISLKCD